MGDYNIWLSLLFQLLLIFLNAIFACAEIAVISMNDAKLSQLAASGNKKAKVLQSLTLNPAKFLATIQVAITLSGFLGSAFAANNFADLFVKLFHKLGIGEEYASILHTGSVVLITLILSYITHVFGELVPKRIAMKKSEKLALVLASPIAFIAKLFAPIVFLLTLSTNLILRLFGINPHEIDEGVTEDEIKMMVDAGSEKGTIDEDEKELIQNVFEFNDLSAGELSTRRTDITMLWMEETAEEWDRTIDEGRHSFYPVCDGTVDNVVAVLNAKDYYRLKDRSRESVMEKATKVPYFVPESVKADVLFKNMKKQKDFFAVVLDEYGGTSGIITVKDLLECIVGEFPDEEKTAEASVSDILHLENNVWQIAGGAPFTDTLEALGIILPEQEEIDCDTFGGYLFSILGAIPEDGSVVDLETEQLAVKIDEIKDHRIERAIVTVKETTKNEDE